MPAPPPPPRNWITSAIPRPIFDANTQGRAPLPHASACPPVQKRKRHGALLPVTAGGTTPTRAGQTQLSSRPLGNFWYPNTSHRDRAQALALSHKWEQRDRGTLAQAERYPTGADVVLFLPLWANDYFRHGNPGVSHSTATTGKATVLRGATCFYLGPYSYEQILQRVTARFSTIQQATPHQVDLLHRKFADRLWQDGLSFLPPPDVEETVERGFEHPASDGHEGLWRSLATPPPNYSAVSLLPQVTFQQQLGAIGRPYVLDQDTDSEQHPYEFSAGEVVEIRHAGNVWATARILDLPEHPFLHSEISVTAPPADGTTTVRRVSRYRHDIRPASQHTATATTRTSRQWSNGTTCFCADCIGLLYPRSHLHLRNPYDYHVGQRILAEWIQADSTSDWYAAVVIEAHPALPLLIRWDDQDSAQRRQWRDQVRPATTSPEDIRTFDAPVLPDPARPQVPDQAPEELLPGVPTRPLQTATTTAPSRRPAHALTDSFIRTNALPADLTLATKGWAHETTAPRSFAAALRFTPPVSPAHGIRTGRPPLQRWQALGPGPASTTGTHQGTRTRGSPASCPAPARPQAGPPPLSRSGGRGSRPPRPQSGETGGKRPVGKRELQRRAKQSADAIAATIATRPRAQHGPEPTSTRHVATQTTVSTLFPTVLSSPAPALLDNDLCHCRAGPKEWTDWHWELALRRAYALPSTRCGWCHAQLGTPDDLRRDPFKSTGVHARVACPFESHGRQTWGGRPLVELYCDSACRDQRWYSHSDTGPTPCTPDECSWYGRKPYARGGQDPCASAFNPHHQYAGEWYAPDFTPSTILECDGRVEFCGTCQQDPEHSI